MEIQKYTFQENSCIIFQKGSVENYNEIYDVFEKMREKKI
jgi:hypothetical protein